MGHLEAAQAHMLQQLHQDVPPDAFYTAILNACAEQQRQDEIKSFHGNRHLLARIASVTEAKGIIGCRSVAYHPHFALYASPTPSDTVLGSVRDGPDDPSILPFPRISMKHFSAVLRATRFMYGL